VQPVLAVQGDIHRPGRIFLEAAGHVFRQSPLVLDYQHPHLFQIIRPAGGVHKRSV